MLKLGILDVKGTKYTLKIGQEYLIGHKSNELSHDIEIDDQSVDIKHSVIDLTQSASPQLFDFCSKYGTFVDDVKIPRFKSFPLAKTSKIRFGSVNASLQLWFEGDRDSGYLEERLNSPTADTSEIISNSPEHISSSGSRLKNSLKNSLTSTPNQSATSSSTSASKPASSFLIPSCLPRTSLGSNTSARSNDSFYIPETQHAPEAGNNSRTNNSTEISLYINISKKNSTAGDDDFFIPETQEVVSSAIPLPNHARVAFPSDDVNETLSQDNRMPSSQFRICTQDFNGSDEELSNQSGDLLANIPLSIVIPTVKHDTVQIDDFAINDEEDIENEMSALQWSRKTAEENNADGSVTPDGLFDVVGSVTTDFIQVKRKSADIALSQSSTPDIFAIPEEPEIVATTTKNQESNKDENLKDSIIIPISTTNDNEKLDQVTKENDENEMDEYPPTQSFFKPHSVNNSFTRSSLLLPPPSAEADNVTKENNLQNEIDEYPPTQAFFKPQSVNNSFTTPSLPPPALPSAKMAEVTKENELQDEPDEYPPTQAFFKPIAANTSITRTSLPPPPATEDDLDSLPETQAFAPLTVKSIPAVPESVPKPQIPSNPNDSKANFSIGLSNHVFALPQASPRPRPLPKPQASPIPQASPKPNVTPNITSPQKSPSSTVQICEDDLPPTQVFLKDDHVPLPIATNVFSSTLVDCDMPLSEHSFRTKFNKLLDSDDDEMDEVIAPELVKQMRECQNKIAHPELVPEEPSTPENNSANSTKQEEEEKAIDKNSEMTPKNNNFRVPVVAPKTNYSKNPAVSIDDFLLTPDFLRKEFSKNSQLQKEAEVKWQNMVLEKRNKELFGDSNGPTIENASDSDDSENSFSDLLPKMRETRSKSVSKPEKEKQVVEEEVVCARVTRRKSTYVKTNAKEEVDKKESKRRGRRTIDKKPDVEEKRKRSDNEKLSKNEKVSSKQEKSKKEDKERETEKNTKMESSSNTKKSSKSTKDAKLSIDPILVENTNLVKNSSIVKPDLAKDSSVVKENLSLSKNSSLTKDSSVARNSSCVKPDLAKNSSVARENSSLSKNSSLDKYSFSAKPQLPKDSSFVKENSSLSRNSSLVKDSAIVTPQQTKESRVVIEKSSLSRNSSLVKDSSSMKSDLPKASSSNRNTSSGEIKKTRSTSKESLSSRTSSINSSKDPKEPTGDTSKETVSGRTRTRRKVQESKPEKPEEPEDKSTRSRATKRNADASKSSSKASKINKLEELDVVSKQNSDKPTPRKTRLRSASQTKDNDKKVTLNKKLEKIKEDAKKEEPAKKASLTTKTNTKCEEFVDLTDSDADGMSAFQKKVAAKRKSQQDYLPYNISQSSAESNDSDRTLRRKKKLRIAITSCSPATRDAVVQYTGRIWEYTDDPKDCDVLILEAGNRTYKLLVAMARGVPVVKVDWFKEVIEMKSTEVSFDKYIFDDEKFQKRHTFSMRNSLQMANNSSLFGGMHFMMTPNITPKPDEMKDIIVCAGGTVLANIPTSQDDRKFYLVSENADNQLWYRYRRASKDLKIVTTNSLMASVMQQSLKPLIKSIH